MGNKMTDKGMSVGLLCSVIGHTVGFREIEWPDSDLKETTERRERYLNEINRTEIGKPFAENQRIGECFVGAGIKALISQLWSIRWHLAVI